MATEIPTPMGKLTIPGPAELPSPEEIPKLLLLMGSVGATAALGAAITAMITAPIQFVVARYVLAGLPHPPSGKS